MFKKLSPEMLQYRDQRVTDLYILGHTILHWALFAYGAWIPLACVREMMFFPERFAQRPWTYVATWLALSFVCMASLIARSVAGERVYNHARALAREAPQYADGTRNAFADDFMTSGYLTTLLQAAERPNAGSWWARHRAYTTILVAAKALQLQHEAWKAKGGLSLNAAHFEPMLKAAEWVFLFGSDPRISRSRGWHQLLFWPGRKLKLVAVRAQ